ncbi:MAG: M48 family metalloprotease [bacterium]|nr:M48 family metalloprotease [bacterium]
MPEPASALEAVRPLLPAWTGWASLAIPPAAFGISATATWFAGRVTIGPLRKMSGACWVERARAAHPHRRIAGAMALAPALMLAMASLDLSGPLSHTPRSLLFALTAVSAYVGSFTARRGFAGEISGRRASLGHDLLREIGPLVLVAPHVVGLFVLNAIVEPEPGAGTWAALGLGASGFALACWAGGLPLLCWLGVARSADAQLATIVESAADRTGVRPSGVYVVPMHGPNAFAFPLSQRLVFSEQITDTIDDNELAAIAGHELGHLSERWPARLARVAGVFALLPFGFVAPIGYSIGTSGIFSLLGTYYLIIFFLVRGVRGLEQRADEVGRGCEANSGDYARALEALHEANLIPAVTGSSNPTHPDLYDRLRSSGFEPAYPRPAPPSRPRLLGVCAVEARSAA